MKYRGSMQEKLAACLKRHKLTFSYELYAVPYVIPAVTQYLKTEFAVECKDGHLMNIFMAEHFTLGRMRELELVKDQQPHLDIRIIFSNPEATLLNSITTYSEWCDERGILWAQARYKSEIKSVVERWIYE